MKTPRTVITLLSVLFLIGGVLFTGTAHSFDGGGTGTLKEAIHIKGCGSVKGHDVISHFAMDPDGQWTLTTPGGSYTGTYTELKSGRRFTLELDSASHARLIATLENVADAACGTSPGTQVIQDETIGTFTAKLSKNRTDMKILLRLGGNRSDGLKERPIRYQWAAGIDFNASGCRRYWAKKKLTLMNAVAVEDINGDNRSDIILSRHSHRMRIKHVQYDGGDKAKADIKSTDFYDAIVLLQDPLEPGTFLRQPDYPVLPKIKKSKSTLWTEAPAVAIGDLDNDGLADFALPRKNFNSAGVFLQDPGTPGVFLPRRDFQAVSQPVDLAIGDLNGDGIDDLAVAGLEMARMTNNPASPGSVFEVTTLGGLTNVTAVAIADLDGDGRNDLAATSGDTVSVLLQDPEPAPAGGFSSNAAYTAGGETTAVATGDLNGDSLPDLAVASRGDADGHVAVLLQSTTVPGSFLPAVYYATGPRSVDVAIGDLNGDAAPDLVVANDSRYGGVSVLLQDSLDPGVFLEADNYPGMSGPEGVAVADMNGDDLADLVVADKCLDPHTRPYIRYQDANHPGKFLYPLPLP
jgi:hypothetical protein